MKRIVEKDGALLLHADGRQLAPAAYMSYCPADADYEGFARIGYRLFSYCVYAADTPVNEENGSVCAWELGCWREQSTFDFAPLDAGMARVCRAVANAAAGERAYVILRINLNMPRWWRAKYPGELMRYAGGRTLMQSIASRRWRQDACIFLQKLKEHIDASPYCENIIGWQVAAMQTEEWIHPSRYRFELQQDAPLAEALREYCRGKYPDIAALNAAWGSAYTGFDEIGLPSAAQLQAKAAQGAAAPCCTRVRDYHTCLNACYADTIAFFIHYVKELYRGDMLCGAFTGYIGQLQDFQGHSTLARLLADPAVDFFASPFAYVQSRGPGVDWICHAPMQAVTAAGKLWFMEADVRTCYTRHLADTRPDVVGDVCSYFDNPVFFGPADEEQSAANILRSFARCFVSGQAYWWFDMWGGWYRSKGLMALHQKLLALYTAGPAQNNSRIAVVLDENASYGLAESQYGHGVPGQLIELGYLGAPYDMLLLDRLADIEPARYNLYLFLCPDTASAAWQGAAARLAAAGKAVLVTGGDTPFYDKAALLRAAQAAGVHIYSHGNIVYANAEYIAVTAVQDGPVRLELPGCGSLTDVLTGEAWTVGCGAVSIPMAFNECRLLRWTPQSRGK